jgi:hypothetical protein
MHTDSCPVQEHLKPNTSIALIPKNVIDLYIAYKISRQGNLGFFHFSPPIKRPLNLPFADALLSINARACLS